MNKVLNINLAGLVFYIDEEAFKILETYLSKIKSYLKNEERSTEIILEIESNIAKLFKQWTTEKEIVGLEEVLKVKEILNKSGNYLIGDLSGKSAGKKEESGVKKLFRDVDNSILGGVCSGIANYFSINKIWVRLSVIILLVGVGWMDLGGSMFVIYILLWIVIPKAKTTSEKLQMYGEPINLGNTNELDKELEGGVEKEVSNSDTYIKSFGDLTLKIIKLFVSVLLAFIGVVILMGVFILMILFITLISLIFGYFELFNIMDYFVEYSWQYYLAISAFIVLLMSTLIIMFKTGVGLITRKLRLYKGFILSLIGLVIVSFITLIGLIVNQSTYYAYDYDLEKEYTIPATHSVALPITITNYIISGDEKLNYNFNIIKDFNFSNLSRYGYIIDKNDNLILNRGEVHLEIKMSDDDQIHFINRFKSSGKNKEDAINNIKNISHESIIDSSKISIGGYFKIPKGFKGRSQEVKSIVYIPVGQKVILDSGFNMEGDLINYSDWGYNNKKYTWQMTSEGLNCIDCVDY